MKIKVGILVMICSVALTGCSTLDQGKDKDKEKKPEVNNSQQQDPGDNNDGSNNPKEEDSKEVYDFKIYSVDEQDTEKIIEFKNLGPIVEDSQDKSLEYNIASLCTLLQKEYFEEGEAKISLESIDSDGIATINLENKDAWGKHFQGSTGGYISQATITETLLQREYKGDWIKGLNVLIDGQSNYEFDHASFNQTFTR